MTAKINPGCYLHRAASLDRENCGRPLKPDVILFGENMAPDFNKAINEVRAAQLILIIEAGMQVAPVNMLPRTVKNLVIINRERTMHDWIARVVIHGDASEATGLIIEELDRRSGRDEN